MIMICQYVITIHYKIHIYFLKIILIVHDLAVHPLRATGRSQSTY